MVVENEAKKLRFDYKNIATLIFLFFIQQDQGNVAFATVASNGDRIVSTNLCIDTLAVELIGAENLLAVSSVADDKKYSTIADRVKNTKKNEL